MKRQIVAALAVFIALAAAPLLLPSSSNAQSGPNGLPALANEPVLIELFTSQGCSSCPPADRLAAKLAREANLIVVSRPVDYWDRLGWKDTFAKPSNTELQRDYARRGLAGYNGVYTPQSVVAGRLGEVGSKESAVRNLVERARGSMRAVIRLEKANGGFGIGINGSSEKATELMLLGMSAREEVAIGRGENGGRTVTYTNVLIGEQRIATWKGGKASYALTASQLRLPGADKYALVLREPGGGPVLAARWVR